MKKMDRGDLKQSKIPLNPPLEKGEIIGKIGKIKKEVL